MDLSPTKLDYYYDMWKLQSKATLLSFFKGEDGRNALILDSTIFHPQGGGQPADTGVITIAADSSFKFIVQDVRSKDGIVYHYGVIEEGSGKDFEMEVLRFLGLLNLNWLHSAGHLMDACLEEVGLGHMEPGKGYHFPDGPFVEYKGTIPQNELQSKQHELELAANALISRGGKASYTFSSFLLLYCHTKKLLNYVVVSFLITYQSLILHPLQDSTPRVVKLGNSAVCCGGTHVSDISEIISLQVSQIRKKKGVTKVSYTVGS
ncbi:hypothetical protein POTOM_060487 [Populus tomentosa]|uniref:Alanyl-tRNA synthetase class IIc N-terminal domain-containing protein n=1 Tax=Populus tomentosa TaxID=118781 RepID=A0A8X7XMW3_POPTO|nr:hypothetical protein POTOM_060487 [Populus tomentosa]